MSLPTYIRRRNEPDVVKFLAKNLGAEFGDKLQSHLRQNPNLTAADVVKGMVGDWSSPAMWTRVMQAHSMWERDFAGYYINPVKRRVRPFWLVPTLESEQALSLAAAGLAGDRINNIQFDVDTQGHFEIAYFMFQATSPNFVVTIMDGGNNNKLLMNSEIHARTIAGTARRPLILPETYFLNVQNAKRTLTMNFRNLHTSTNVIRWCFHGRRWYHKAAEPEVQRAIENRFGLMEKTYTYFLTLQQTPPSINPNTPVGANLPGITLALGQALFENSAPFFTSTSEADTEIHKLTYTATGPFEFQLRERESGRTLSNGFIRVESGWGDGEFPFIYPETHLIERNYQLLFEVRNLHTSTNIIYPTLIGRRMQYA